ncbi:MAG: hypothetical protein OQJ89_09955 [Kangiellaceae bacterium]|nr:hypothetical protein [Kangiellaceae bacterium]MCW9017279.1 hypothetical protein [Kangiellaceae bacterium]
MVEQAFIALLKAGLPVFLVSLVTLYWINNRSDKQFHEIIEKKEKSHKDEKDSEEDKHSDFLHKKWVQFGGGFYGMVGLWTYLVVEWKELTTIITDFKPFDLTISNIITEVIIKFLIESILNLLTALTWPIYWIGKMQGTSIWLAFIAAYLGYWVAETLLKNHFSKHQRQ